jgi:hypothetical protein
VARFVALSVGGAVHGRNRLHRKGSCTASAGQIDGLPLLEAMSRRPQPARGARMRENERRGERYPTPFRIEIVGVLVVTDQHDVDAAQRHRRDGRARGLREVCLLPRRIERRVDDHPAPGDVDDGGGST